MVAPLARSRDQAKAAQSEFNQVLDLVRRGSSAGQERSSKYVGCGGEDHACVGLRVRTNATRCCDLLADNLLERSDD
jgi:hypothetical protein